MNTTPILRATNIVKKLGGKTILNDVSLDVHKGDVKVVIGPSGAGKSTFLQCLNYLLPPDSGDIWLEGKKVNARDTRELCALRQQVGMIFQDFNLFDHLTAEENVSIALRKVMGCNKAEARNRALTELSRVGLAKRAALYPAQLSGGQKQRVAIARALAMDPKVMLLDEPTSALDPELVGEVLSVIRDLADGGMTMIMATHQMDFARALATDILFMEQGKIIEQGAPDVLLPLCDRIWIDGRAEPMTDAHRAEIAARNHAMTGSALRVLAAAMRTYDALPGDTSPAALEQHLCFLGLTGMIDPVRPEVVDAIRACRSAGIRPVMITGDHVDTAKAIARELGLLGPGDEAVTGTELSAIDDETFSSRLRHISVYARV